jgi:SAM-dependent methyltransferase
LLLADVRCLAVRQRFELIVLAYRTLQHLDPASRRRFWSEVGALLSPGGRLAFDTWHGPIPMSGTRELAITPATVDDIRRELGQAGLRVITVRAGFDAVPDVSSFNRVWIVDGPDPPSVSHAGRSEVSYRPSAMGPHPVLMSRKRAEDRALVPSS